MTESSKDTLFEFPCDFPPESAVGSPYRRLPQHRAGIVQKHARPDRAAPTSKKRPSSSGSYLSLDCAPCTVHGADGVNAHSA